MTFRRQESRNPHPRSTTLPSPSTINHPPSSTQHGSPAPEGKDCLLQIVNLGRRDYKEVWDFQKDLVTKRQARVIPDTLILVEHDPVYTLGKNGDESHLLGSRRRDIPVYRVERGGDVTYHGPGQLVGYPILDLHDHRLSISWYMRSLEEVILRALLRFDIRARRRPGLTGVWVENEKIAALGVRLSRWVSMHGFALNVNTDLTPFAGIIPCGIGPGRDGVTSMEALLNEPQDLNRVANVVVEQFLDVFSFH